MSHVSTETMKIKLTVFQFDFKIMLLKVKEIMQIGYFLHIEITKP